LRVALSRASPADLTAGRSRDPRGRFRPSPRPPRRRKRRRHPPRRRRLAPEALGEHPAMPLEVLDAVLTLPFVGLRLAQDLRAAALGAAEVGVDVIDVDDEAIDDVRILEPLAGERAGLGVPTRALVCIARMTHEHG